MSSRGNGTGAGGDSHPRFLTDEDFNREIVKGLRHARPAMDIATAVEAATLGLPDPDVLAVARRLDRILLSHDTHTMPAHFYAFLSALGEMERSPGAMLVPQELAIGRAIEAVLEVWECSRHEEWQDLLTRLPL